jgi:hypothetical protein
MKRSSALKALRVAAILAVTGMSIGCVRDTFAAPFFSQGPFRPWIPEPWRTAYPWACAGTVAVAALARSRGRLDASTGALSLTWSAALIAARVAAPAFYALLSSLLPGSIRDDLLIPCVFAGLALENLLPTVVLAALAFSGLGHVAVRAGGGWPARMRGIRESSHHEAGQRPPSERQSQ